MSVRVMRSERHSTPSDTPVNNVKLHSADIEYPRQSSALAPAPLYESEVIFLSVTPELPEDKTLLALDF